MGTTIMVSLMFTWIVFALFIVDSEAYIECHLCKCCHRNKGPPPNYMNWWARPTRQFPQYGPQLPQYGNYGGLWGGRYEWGAGASQSHAGPWSHINMGK